MARLLGALLLCLGLAGPAWAQSEGSQSTINGQMEAFRADDFDRAFTYASPNIKRMFGSSENFGTMVRNGYPMVWRPAEVTYLELREENGSYWQKVKIEDAEGRVNVLDYRMLDTENGWKIYGEQLLESAGVSA